jgi:hypothetical protein
MSLGYTFNNANLILSQSIEFVDQPVYLAICRRYLSLKRLGFMRRLGLGQVLVQLQHRLDQSDRLVMPIVRQSAFGFV